ncbi:peptidase M4 family protein [Macrococcoides goetzii]|nr:peptidase M4 family protein [Macrococcus goetzii]
MHINPQGKVVLINGETDAKISNPTNIVKLSKQAAISKAFEAINIKESEAKNFSGAVVKKAELNIDGDAGQYVYDIELITTSPSIGHWNIKINAENGQITAKQNLIETAATTGLGLGVIGSYKTININSATGGYTLEDFTHTGRLETYQYNSSTGQGTIVSDTDKTFNATNQRAAVDSHYYAGRVYDYFKNIHGRDSYDGLGTGIPSLVGVNTINTLNDYRNNAAWIGDKMIYGDGDGTKFRATSGAIDVVAHEITHGVTQTTAKLVNQGQAGALNESMSDVFAYFIDPQDWLIAEDVYTPSIAGDGLRSLANPEVYGQPSNMSGYYNTTADYGGIHTNIGIPNKAAYNTITTIGKEKSEKIYYRALTQYLTSTSTFLDAKNALVQSAKDLYGTTVADRVTAAGDKVGVK